ncbi:MAG: hypothetical protein DRG40_01935 [Deltaproteobacteria bacterium]|nr:MAG: hypothetical protein DRG40_01935 [Deltaproteobacteria bacterium]
MGLTLKKWLIILMSAAFLAALLIVGYIESGKLRPEKRPPVRISKENRYCIDCHKRKGMAPKLIEQWEMSLHAVKGAGCVECHIDPNLPSEKDLGHGLSSPLKNYPEDTLPLDTSQSLPSHEEGKL